MKLIVEVKSYYGKEFYYPLCEKSLLLAKLMKQNTFTKAQIDALKEIGFEICTEAKKI